MVYRVGGTILLAFGVVMLVAPTYVLQWQNWRQPTNSVEITDTRERVVRAAGVAFLAIGAAFVLGDPQGWLG